MSAVRPFHPAQRTSAEASLNVCDGPIAEVDTKAAYSNETRAWVLAPTLPVEPPLNPRLACTTQAICHRLDCP